MLAIDRLDMRAMTSLAQDANQDQPSVFLRQDHLDLHGVGIAVRGRAVAQKFKQAGAGQLLRPQL